MLLLMAPKVSSAIKFNREPMAGEEELNCSLNLEQKADMAMGSSLPTQKGWSEGSNIACVLQMKETVIEF